MTVDPARPTRRRTIRRLRLGRVAALLERGLAPPANLSADEARAALPIARARAARHVPATPAR